jgi:hypothetical protein
MSGTARAVETCRITGTLYLHDGSPAAGLRVEVRESALPGTPTANRQLVYYCDSAGFIDFPAIRTSDIRVFAQARGFDLDCEGVWLHVPDADAADISTLVPPEGFDPPTHVIVVIPSDPQIALNFIPPLVKTGIDVSMPQASATVDGYLAAGDYARFNAGQPPGGVSGDLQFNNAGVFAGSNIKQTNPNTVTLRNGLGTNQQFFRITYTDDGAGNAKYLEFRPGTASWHIWPQGTGTHASARQALSISSAGNEIFIGGDYLDESLEYGDWISIKTADFKNGVTVYGNYLEPLDSALAPGVYIQVNSANVYNYTFLADGLTLAVDPTAPMHATTKQYVDSKGINLAADYPWTGNHSWTKSLVVDVGASLNLKHTSGYAVPMVQIEPINHIPMIGPGLDYNGGAGGIGVQYLCGTGAWSGTSYGACYVNYGNNWTWDFNAHIAVRGNLVMQGGLLGGGSTLTLYADPTQPMHAATKQYVDNKPSGGSPGGTAAEIQYRASATTFAAAPGSDIGTSTNWPGTPRAIFNGVLKVMANASTFYGVLELSDRGGGVYMAVSQINNTIPPFSAFQAIHTTANPGILYFGRGTGGFGAPDCARIINFYTGATGQEDTRRLYISKNGSVHVNEQTVVDSTYALTTSAGLGGSFANAFLANGPCELGSAGGNTGFCVGSLGRVGFGCAAGGSTERLTISVAGGVSNAILISDLATYAVGIGLTGGVFSIGTNATIAFSGANAAQPQLKLTSLGVEIWDGAASKQIKIGAAGTGPGGVGRMLYVD